LRNCKSNDLLKKFLFLERKKNQKHNFKKNNKKYTKNREIQYHNFIASEMEQRKGFFFCLLQMKFIIILGMFSQNSDTKQRMRRAEAATHFWKVTHF